MRIDNNSSSTQYSILIAGSTVVLEPMGWQNVEDNLGPEVYAQIQPYPDLVAYSDKSLIFNDGQTLQGTYNGSVVVMGSASIIGNLIINGSINVEDSLTNNGGYSVVINGDMSVNSFSFSPSGPEVEQSNIDITGDLRFYDSSDMNCSTNGVELSVGGDFMGYNAQFNCFGLAGINGLTVQVSGDLNIEDFICYGGDATETSGAGHGGSLQVNGNCMSNDELDFHGGNSSFDGQNAGNGGQLTVWQNCQAYIYGPGGTANANCWAGSGMSISIWGNFYNYYVNLNGGDYNGTQSAYGAGSGGYIEVGGDVLLQDSLDLNGGNINETITDTTFTQGAPNAGYFYCGGDCIIDAINLNGGSNNSSSSNTNGGNGGSCYVYGNFNANSNIYLGGGNSVTLNGGNAGGLWVYGAVACNAQINLTAGSSSSGPSNGSTGSVYFYSGGQVNSLIFQDGTGDSGNPTSTVGLFFSGNMTIGALQINNRDSIYVQGFTNNCLFTVAAYTGGKVVFTQPNGSNTNDVSSFIGTNSFMYDPNNGWFNFPGTPLVGG